MSGKPPSYVTGVVCAECHPAESDRWEGSHHDLAMQVASDETVLGDFAGTQFEYFGRSTSFYKKRGDFFVRTTGSSGSVGEFRVAYTFGASPLQQYLLELPGGRFQALGVAWDARLESQGGQRWFHLYPDEDVNADHPVHWTARDQNWNANCAECHSTGLEKNYDGEADRYSTAWSDVDVSCEACHGQGSRHVAWARAEEPEADGLRGLTVSPGNAGGPRWTLRKGERTATRSGPRGAESELNSCTPCQSRRRRLVDRPAVGAPFLNGYHPSLLEEDLYYTDGQIQGEVYVYGSFLQSRMYARGVTCSDCHDPHSTQVRDSTNALCGVCHESLVYDTRRHHFHETDSRGARCVECHMPARTYMGVDARRDHSFRIPRPDLSVSLNVPNPCTACHADRGAAWAASAVARRYGPARPLHFAETFHLARKGDPKAKGPLITLATDTTQPGIVRATGIGLLGQHIGAAYRRTVAETSRDPNPLVRLAAAGAVERLDPNDRHRLVAGLLADSIRAVRNEAARVLAPVARSQLSPQEGAALEQGLASYVAAELVNRDRPEAHLNIGLVRLYGGRFGEAESSFLSAIERDSTFVPAYVNLADLRRLQGSDSEGRAFIEAALAASPDHAAAHHALGLLLVREKRTDEAMTALRRATELEPDHARFAYVYGIALHSTGRPREAVAVLDRAVRRHPFDRELLLGLASVHRERGDFEAALQHAERLVTLAPEVSSYEAFVRQLRSERDRDGR